MRNIALVAHGVRKEELIEWFKYNIKTILDNGYRLYTTGTTGKLLKDVIYEQLYTDYPFYDKFQWRFGKTMDEFIDERLIILLSGPLGGDQQISRLVQ